MRTKKKTVDMAGKANTQVVISEKAKSIVDEYTDDLLFTEKKSIDLIVSLYATRNDANVEVSNALQSSIVNLSEIIGDDNLALLMSEYKPVIQYVDKKRNWLGGGRWGVKDLNDYASLSIRQEVVDLCVKLMGCEEKTTVFLPYARDSKFAIQLRNCVVEGFETNATNWALSSILMDAYDIPINIVNDVRQFDTEKQYDYIISCPPAVLEGKSDVVQSMTGWLERSLNTGGTMCLLLPQYFTSSSKWHSFRSYIVDHKREYNMLVISLPADSFVHFCEIEMCIVLVGKTNKPWDNYIFMDANKSEFVSLGWYSDCPLKVDAIMDVLHSSDADPRYIQLVPKDKLTGNCDFTPKRYFVYDHLTPPKRYLKEDEQLVSIVDLVDFFVNFQNTPKKTTGKVIGMRELSDKFLDAEIDIDSLPDIDVKGCKAVPAKGLFVGYLNGKFKIGRITKDCNTDTVYLRHEIIQLFLKPESIVTEDFLMMSLLGEDVERQANMLAVGTILHRLSHDDFKLLKIIVPSTEEQNRQVRLKSSKALIDANAKVLEKFDEFRMDMHVKKHAVGQTIFNLNNWFSLLKVARKQGNGIVDDNAVIGKAKKMKVSEIYDNIDTVLSTITHQIRMFDVGYGMQPSAIDLVDFIREYVKNHVNPLFEYDFDATLYGVDQIMAEMEKGEEGAMTEYYVNFPKEALTTILDNIITNACVHGFEDKDSENRVRIEISKLGTDIRLRVMNNGKPLQEGISVEDVFKYSISTGGKDHYGIGGYEIRKLMREFDGEAEIELSPHSDYTLCYLLTFHNTTVDVNN